MALTLLHALGAGGADLPVPARLLQISLPPDERAPQRARAAVAAACERWEVPELVTAAELAASELVSNAVLHARTPMILMAEQDAGQLLIAVADGDPRLPAELTPSEQEEHGRGLQIVDALGATWGIQRTALGKTVWVLLDTHTGAAVDGDDAAGSGGPA